jgi:hypothetical protein
VDDAERDVDPAALPAGVGLALAVAILAELEGVQRGGGPTARLGLADPVQPGLQHELLARGGLVPRAAALGDVADPAAHLARFAAQVGSGDRRLAAVGLDERRQHAQGRGLAGSIRAEEAEDLPLGDLEVDAADRVHGLLAAAVAGAERLPQSLGLDHHVFFPELALTGAKVTRYSAPSQV